LKNKYTFFCAERVRKKIRFSINFCLNEDGRMLVIWIC